VLCVFWFRNCAGSRYTHHTARTQCCEAVRPATECSTLLQLVSSAPTVRQVLQRKHRVQAQIGGLEAAEEVDYCAVGDLLLQLESLDLQAARLPMTEEDYLTLKNRHAALVKTVTTVCRQLIKARQYAALRDMAAQLGALKAVDVTALHL
jgi:hypothetical protein